MPTPISRVLPALVGLVLLVGAAGCASSDAEDTKGARSLDPPVKVQHKFGSATVKAVPKRVVTLDAQWTDVMLAMGVQPVGYSVDKLMPKTGVPWQRLPKEAKPLAVEDGVPVEQIAALKPDLIVGTYTIRDKEAYDQVAGIAPTIAQLDSRQVTPWQDLVRAAGKVLAEPAKATQVIGSVESKIDATAKALPGLKGKTFALSQYIVGDQIYIVSDEKDGSSSLFQRLGMKLYPPVVKEGAKTRQVRVGVSTERADLLRADLLAFLVNGGDRSDLADIPGFGKLPGTVAVLDYPTVVGLNGPTPLSIPYALTKLRPYLDKAGAKS